MSGVSPFVGLPPANLSLWLDSRTAGIPGMTVGVTALNGPASTSSLLPSSPSSQAPHAPRNVQNENASSSDSIHRPWEH